MAIDQFSNIYVSGGFQGTGNYGPYSITSNGEWDAFIFKMDKDGNWLWAEGFGSNKTDRANSIAIDVCDDIYITGEYRNPMVFPGANASNGTDTLSHKQKRDVFVAKMNNQGQWKWAKRARTSGTDKPYQMSVDANKQVFIGGTAKGEMTFTSGLVAPPQIPGDTTMSAWVAQIDGTSNNGDWVWAKMAGADTDDDDRTGDICPDGFGNVYAIGFFEDAADLYVINTCSVTENANRECRRIIRKAKKNSPTAFIVVTGCFAQLKPKEISDIEGVDMVLGAHEKFNLPQLLTNLNTVEETEIHGCEIEELDYFTSYSLNDRTRSFLKIQDGCDYPCTYCTIPPVSYTHLTLPTNREV